MRKVGPGLILGENSNGISMTIQSSRHKYTFKIIEIVDKASLEWFVIILSLQLHEIKL